MELRDSRLYLQTRLRLMVRVNTTKLCCNRSSCAPTQLDEHALGRLWLCSEQLAVDHPPRYWLQVWAQVIGGKWPKAEGGL